jgi:hypothetical protein
LRSIRWPCHWKRKEKSITYLLLAFGPISAIITSYRNTERTTMHLPDDLPEYMPLAELSRVANFPYSTAKARVNSGEIEVYLINKKVVVKVSEALAIMAVIRKRGYRSHLSSKREDLFSA